MKKRLAARLRQCSAARLAALAGLVATPGLFIGLVLDDYWLRAHLVHTARVQPALRPAWDLFSFYTSPSSTAFLRDVGVAPWWTDPELRIRFFRPISSLDHLLDYWLLGGSPLAQHVHSLLLYVLSTWVVVGFLREVASSRLAAAIGGIVFAVAASHAVPAAWISNRNALLATLATVVSAWLHVRAIRSNSPKRVAMGALAFGVGLGCAELAAGGIAFFAAAELALASDAPWRRALRLAPSLGVLVAWQATYRGLGFGVHGSGMYLDPGTDLWAFLSAVPMRWSALVGAALSGVPPDLLNFSPRVARPLVALGFLALAIGVVALVAPTLRRHRSARFFLLAVLAASLPACATLATGRLLMLVSVASSGLLGEGFAWLLTADTGRARRWIGVSLALVNGPLAVLFFVGVTLGVLHADRKLQRASRDLNALGLADAQCVVFVRAPMLVNGYFGVQRDALGWKVPAAMLTLASTEQPLSLRSEAKQTLLLDTPDGLYADGDIGTLTRRLDRPLPTGSRVEHPCGAITVLDTTDGGIPTRIRFEPRGGDVPLLRWDDGRLERVPVPETGARLQWPASGIF